VEGASNGVTSGAEARLQQNSRHKANLRKANLRKANLRKANLRKARRQHKNSS
jgi:uncharacterized protein YjbI with pentapeptide repeats